MKASFSYGGKRFINFDLDSDEFKALNIDEETKRSIINKAQLDAIIASRQAAYKAESDPLFMEAQYDGTPELHQKWQDKVAEIKARYPLPDNA